MFNEQMDKTVMEAKGEIEAFCQNKLNSIAQAALKRSFKSWRIQLILYNRYKLKGSYDGQKI